MYNELIHELLRVIPIAEQIYEAQKDQKVSNCGIIAHRIKEFKLASIVPVIKKSITEMHEFFIESYKGVYCSLCDANNQGFFDADKKSAILSEKFCREVTGSSLHVLLYFHVHFKKILTLSNALVTMCDIEGKYLEDQSVPGAVHLVVKEADKMMLFDCRKYRNDPGWIEHCGGICEEFHLSRYAEFFQPDIKKYHKATLYLRDKLELLDPQEEEEEEEGEGNERILTSLSHLKRRFNKNRLLDEGDEETEEEIDNEEEGEGEEEEDVPLTIPELEQKYDDLNVLLKREEAEIKLDKMSITYQQPGVELYEAGVATILTEEAYQAVLDEIALQEKLAKQAEPEEEGVGIIRIVGSLSLFLFTILNL